MSIADLTSIDAVEQALNEFDSIGREAFLAKYGFGAAKAFYIVRDGKRYDSKAIAGAAFGYQFAERGPLSASEFSGGTSGAVGVLKKLGFVVETDPEFAGVRARLLNLKSSTSPSGTPTPHQALLVLTALQRIVAGQERLGQLSDFEGPLQAALSLSMSGVKNPSALEPIWRLEPGLWEIRLADGAEPAGQGTGRPPIGVLHDVGVTCGFRGPIDSTLRSHFDDIPQLVDDIIQKYLTGVPRTAIEQTGIHMSSEEGTPPRRLLVIHIGVDSTDNFDHSLQDGIWGWKTYVDRYAEIQPGDLIMFGLGFTGGRVRQPSERFVTYGYRRVVIGVVTSNVVETTELYWPDEMRSGTLLYPYHITFEVTDDRGPQLIEALDAEFSANIGDGLFHSANTQMQGKIVLIPGDTQLSNSIATLADVVDEFSTALRATGLDYGPDRHEKLARTFVTSLATKRFVILTGLSGSGKTQIAKQFGRWLGPDRSLVVPVRPDWTNPDPLLGYENGLSPLVNGLHAWSVPEPLAFILRAARDTANPYLLILDEMNLAHVERYFADLLSGMESGEPVVPNLALIDGAWRIADVSRQRLAFPSNLFIVGTVNVDETTYMFSPKVLDRANTIELRVKTSELSASANPIGAAASGNQSVVRAFLKAASQPASAAPNVEFVQWMTQLHGALTRHGREYGHRTFFEANRFATLLENAGEADPHVALDLQVLQKILPKFHGSIREIRDVLDAVGAWCYVGPGGNPPSSFDVVTANAAEAKLTESFDKLQRMARRLRENHFVSFAE